MEIIEYTQEYQTQLEKLKSTVWSAADIEHYGDNQPYFFKEEFTLLAKEGDDVVGYITLICDSGVAQIEPLMVDPEKKGQGIGLYLLQEAEKLAKEKGVHKLWLETGEGWKAKEFYLKHGYSIRTELPNHTGEYNFILMDKMI